MDNRLNYGTKEKDGELERGKPISNVFSYPISNIEGAIRFFLGRGKLWKSWRLKITSIISFVP